MKEIFLLSNILKYKGKHTCKQLLLKYIVKVSQKWEIIASYNSFSNTANKDNFHPQEYFAVGPFNKGQGDRPFFFFQKETVQYKGKIMMKEDKRTYKIQGKKCQEDKRLE